MDNKGVCCIVAFLFIFIILVVAIVWSNYSSFECFGDVMKANNETLKQKIMGGKYFHALNQNENLFESLKDKPVCVIAVLADWCGYCKQLKDSGTLKDIAKSVPVHMIDDKHPQAPIVMQQLESGGFPTLALYKNGAMSKYEGPRDANSVLKAVNEM